MTVGESGPTSCDVNVNFFPTPILFCPFVSLLDGSFRFLLIILLCASKFLVFIFD